MMAEEYKEQTAKEWGDAFNPHILKHQKTYTEIIHEKDKRAQKELETPESQLIIHHMKEGFKEEE